MNFKECDVVEHSIFGKGIVIKVFDNYCLIDFYRNGSKYTTKAIANNFLKIIDEKILIESSPHIDENFKENTENDFCFERDNFSLEKTYNAIIRIMELNNLKFAPFIEICKILKRDDFFTKFSERDLKLLLEPSNGMIYLQHIKKLRDFDLNFISENKVKLNNKYKDEFKEINRKKYLEIFSDIFDNADTEIYSLDNLVRLFHKKNVKLDINRFCLDIKKTNYKILTSNIICLKSIYSLDEFLKARILSNEICRYSNPWDIKEYDDALSKLEKENKILKVDNGVYVTSKLMAKEGINKYSITRFHSKLDNFAAKHDYFSYENIFNSLEDDAVVKFCLNSQQLDSFINTDKNIFKIKVDNSIIFTANKDLSDRRVFLLKIIGNQESIDIYDLKDIIKDKYKVDYSLDTIIDDINGTSLYYSDDTEKIYLNKDIFIREVFGDEK